MIDLITLYHLKDIRIPKKEYTFYAPENSGIQEDDYVIVASDRGKESICKVTAVLANVDTSGDTLKFIRKVSTIGNNELKPILFKLDKTPVLAPVVKTIYKVDNDSNRLIKKAIEIGTTYYSIELNDDCGDPIIANCYTFSDHESDYQRINDNNVFFDKTETEIILRVIREKLSYKLDVTYSDILGELNKILF